MDLQYSPAVDHKKSHKAKLKKYKKTEKTFKYCFSDQSGIKKKATRKSKKLKSHEYIEMA